MATTRGARAEIVEPESARLRLRQWRASDREPFAALNADPRVMEYFPAPLSRAASDALADRFESFIDEHGWGLWAAELKSSGEFAGFIGLSRSNVALPFSPCVEIGWRLVHRLWGNGYASEGATCALQAGFESLGLDEIVSFTSVLNERSRAVMRRIGMLDDAETFEHPGVPPGSPLRKHCLYRMTKGNWLERGR